MQNISPLKTFFIVFCVLKLSKFDCCRVRKRLLQDNYKQYTNYFLTEVSIIKLKRFNLQQGLFFLFKVTCTSIHVLKSFPGQLFPNQTCIKFKQTQKTFIVTTFVLLNFTTLQMGREVN